MSTMRLERHPRTAFAEIAETCGCRTDEVIVAGGRHSGLYAVFFLTDSDDMDNIAGWTCLLARDSDGILCRVSEPVPAPWLDNEAEMVGLVVDVLDAAEAEQ